MGSQLNGKQAPQLNMKHVAKVDETVVTREGFGEDTSHADEFKDRILNTNLVID